MQNTNFDETQPTNQSAQDGSQEITQITRLQEPSGSLRQDLPTVTPRTRWGLIIFVCLLILIMIGGISGYQGYRQGIQDRIVQRSTEQVVEIERQYQLGLESFQAKDFEMARQRFEYVLEQDPNHARAIEMLARTLTELFATATLTPVVPTSTPTMTPTPDLRSVEEKLNEARAHVNSSEWDQAIETLLALRKENPQFQAVQVDSMLYVSLRNRGVDKILKNGELEGGLFDLSQAELFGPLDSESQGYSNWARFYIIGASFWQVDWGQAAYYFGQVAPFAPNLHDGTYWTASQRYDEAMVNYINQLIDAKDWCRANDQMTAYRNFNSDPQFEPTAVVLEKRCKNKPDQETETPEP